MGAERMKDVTEKRTEFKEETIKELKEEMTLVALPPVDPEALLKRLHHIQVLLKRALKRAKTFTIQKTMKRAKKKEETTEYLESLIKDLKGLDLDELVNLAFHLFINSLEDQFTHILKSMTPQLLEKEDKEPTTAQSMVLSASGMETAFRDCKTSLQLLFIQKKRLEELKARSYKKVFPEKKPGHQKTRKRKVRETTDEPNMASRFIGSLGASDVSDDDVELAETIEAKKNRPGQRARREIWEKKYGAQANHIKNAPKENLNQHPIKQKEEDLSSLHPSWAAKKKQKLVIASAHASANQGQKIKFDQDSEPSTFSHSKPVQSVNHPSAAHPSWEAKKREKEAMANKIASAPKPKKIVFE